MARYTLLPGKKHTYHDGKSGFRKLEPGETIELSDSAYEALSDKFVPEGTNINKDDLEGMRNRAENAERELAALKEQLAAKERAANRAENAERELAALKEQLAAKERAANTQSAPSGEAAKPGATQVPTLTKAKDSDTKA